MFTLSKCKSCLFCALSFVCLLLFCFFIYLFILLVYIKLILYGCEVLLIQWEQDELKSWQKHNRTHTLHIYSGICVKEQDRSTHTSDHRSDIQSTSQSHLKRFSLYLFCVCMSISLTRSLFLFPHILFSDVSLILLNLFSCPLLTSFSLFCLFAGSVKASKYAENPKDRYTCALKNTKRNNTGEHFCLCVCVCVCSSVSSISRFWSNVVVSS